MTVVQSDKEFNRQTERIRVGDIDIAYRWDGVEHGPVVMMAHALGTSLQLWDPQVVALGDRYRLLRYDWRGHGDTDAPPGPYSLAQFEADALGLMDALGLHDVHWVGISTGGMIGQGLAINHSPRIRTLTLCNTTSQWSASYRDWVAERQAIVRRDGMQPVWEMAKRIWFTDAYVEEGGAGYDAVRDVFVRTKVDGYLGSLSAVADLSYRDHLHTITCPTRIFASGDDPVTPAEMSCAIRDRIKGSTLRVIEGQRHFSNVEVADQFNLLLRAGLDEMVGS